MHVISRPALEAAKRKHPDAVGWIDGWWGIAKRMQWESLDDVRRAYPASTPTTTGFSPDRATED